MKIHEYQAKELLRNAGVPVLAGKVAHSVDEAASASDEAEMRRRLDKISKPDTSVVGPASTLDASRP